jgi:hypothetical protein
MELPTKQQIEAMTGQQLVAELARLVDMLRAPADDGRFDRVPA